MAMPPGVQVFETGLMAARPVSPSVETVIRSCIDQAAREVAKESDARPRSKQEGPSIPFAQPVDPSEDLLGELKEYLTSTAMILQRLTEHLVKGPHIDQMVLETLRNSRKRTGLSDMFSSSTKDVQWSELNKIKETTAKYACEVQKICCPPKAEPEPSPRLVPTPAGGITPILGVSRTLQITDDEEQPAPKTRRVRHNGTRIKSPSSDDMSDSASSSGELFEGYDKEALRHRGKGAHYCPKGLRCTKGGVDKDGKLIKFDRNSSFVQHWNKHEKPYLCNLPGCPNPPKKRKFARRDGLERHQRTVRHVVPPT